jgi:hypothetical protein
MARRQGRQLAEKVTVGLFHWATTDHSGISSVLAPMGFIDTVKFIFLQLLLVVANAILTGILVFLLIAYGIPFLLDRLF